MPSILFLIFNQFLQIRDVFTMTMHMVKTIDIVWNNRY